MDTAGDRETAGPISARRLVQEIFPSRVEPDTLVAGPTRSAGESYHLWHVPKLMELWQRNC